MNHLYREQHGCDKQDKLRVIRTFDVSHNKMKLSQREGDNVDFFLAELCSSVNLLHVLLPNALAHPWTMVIMTHDAQITVITVPNLQLFWLMY